MRVTLTVTDVGDGKVDLFCGTPAPSIGQRLGLLPSEVGMRSLEEEDCEMSRLVAWFSPVRRIHSPKGERRQPQTANEN
jgi:hypothetical protein